MAMHPLSRIAPIAALAATSVVIGCGDGERSGAQRTNGATSTAESAPGAASTSAARCSRNRTPAQTEGPYFRAGSPARASLAESGMRGTRLVLTGRVLTSGCRGLDGVRLDFWQANAQGVYDNSGYRLRGHQSTDARGRFRLTTIVPGEYAGRTEHIHVKVAPRGGSTLTTQLYFPRAARNDEDGIFDSDLLMRVRDAAGGKQATFDFVLPA